MFTEIPKTLQPFEAPAIINQQTCHNLPENLQHRLLKSSKRQDDTNTYGPRVLLCFALLGARVSPRIVA